MSPFDAIRATPPLCQANDRQFSRCLNRRALPHYKSSYNGLWLREEQADKRAGRVSKFRLPLYSE